MQNSYPIINVLLLLHISYYISIGTAFSAAVCLLLETAAQVRREQLEEERNQPSSRSDNAIDNTNDNNNSSSAADSSADWLDHSTIIWDYNHTIGNDPSKNNNKNNGNNNTNENVSTIVNTSLPSTGKLRAGSLNQLIKHATPESGHLPDEYL